jgi:hypothetical protein
VRYFGKCDISVARESISKLACRAKLEKYKLEGGNFLTGGAGDPLFFEVTFFGVALERKTVILKSLRRPTQTPF